MTIKLDHMIVHTLDHLKKGHEFADIMDVRAGRMKGTGYDFTVVRINSDLALYFMEAEEITLQQHMAFTVDGATFDKIIKRLEKRDISYGNRPHATENARTDHEFAPRGLYWAHGDECLFEVMTYEF